MLASAELSRLVGRAVKDEQRRLDSWNFSLEAFIGAHDGGCGRKGLRFTGDERVKVQGVDRSWLYLDDARVADPGAVRSVTSVAYTSVGTNPDPTSAP